MHDKTRSLIAIRRGSELLKTIKSSSMLFADNLHEFIHFTTIIYQLQATRLFGISLDDAVMIRRTRQAIHRNEIFHTPFVIVVISFIRRFEAPTLKSKRKKNASIGER